MAIGDNLKRLRKEKGYTQAKLAELSDIKLGHISKLERNESDPKLTTLIKLMNALETTPDNLLLDTQSTGLTGMLKSYFNRANKLSAQDKGLLIQVIEKWLIADSLKQTIDQNFPEYFERNNDLDHEEMNQIKRHSIENLVDAEEEVEGLSKI